MGYDDGECVECRCDLNGGNNSTDLRYNMCLGCLHEVSKDTAAMDHRLLYVLKDHMEYSYGNFKCDRCGEDCTVYFNVSVCKIHYNNRRALFRDDGNGDGDDSGSERSERSERSE